LRQQGLVTESLLNSSFTASVIAMRLSKQIQLQNVAESGN